MATLAPRLKALAKQIAALERDGSPAALAALRRLEAALDEAEALLPAHKCGRPRKPEFPQDFMAGLVDWMKTLPAEVFDGKPITSDGDALRWLERRHKSPRSLKTLRNQLARARKRR